MMAPPPRNELEHQLRNEVNAALSGSCSSAITDDAPLFLLSESETSFVNCQSGLPINDGDLYKNDDLGKASTYGEIKFDNSAVQFLTSLQLYGQLIPVQQLIVVGN